MRLATSAIAFVFGYVVVVSAAAQSTPAQGSASSGPGATVSEKITVTGLSGTCRTGRHADQWHHGTARRARILRVD